MLYRTILEALLDWEFEDLDLQTPDDIPRDVLAEAISQYIEDDDEWLKDNLKSFLEYNNPDWD